MEKRLIATLVLGILALAIISGFGLHLFNKGGITGNALNVVISGSLNSRGDLYEGDEGTVGISSNLTGVISSSSNYYSAPEINLLEVEDSSSTSRIFSFEVFDYSNVTNCIVFLDDGKNKTSNSIIIGINNITIDGLSVRNYEASVNCTNEDDLEGSSNVQAFSVLEIPKTPGGSSFLGGGSAIALSYTISDSSMNSGYARSLRRNDSLQFSILNESHSLTLDEILNDSVRITVRSEPKKYEIKLNETQKIDFNEDGFYDLEIGFTKVAVNNYSVFISVKSINEKYDLEVEEPSENQELTTDSEGEVSTNFNWLLILYLVIGIIVIGIIIYLITRLLRGDSIQKKRKIKLDELISLSESELANGKKKEALEFYNQAKKYYESKVDRYDHNSRIFMELMRLAEKLK